MELNWRYNKYVLGIDVTPLKGNEYLDPTLFYLINEQQQLHESFLSTVINFSKDKISQNIDTIKDWKDAAVIFAKILSNGELLNDFLGPLRRRVDSLIKKVGEFLKKINLDSLFKGIENIFNKSEELKGWKKLLVYLSLGGILFYLIKKVKNFSKDKIKKFITNFLSESFLESVLDKITDWKSYMGWLSPIIGGVSALYGFLKELLTQFSDAIKSNSKWATKLIKENKHTMNKLQKKQLQEKIYKILREDDKENDQKQINSLSHLGDMFIQTGKNLKGGKIKGLDSGEIKSIATLLDKIFVKAGDSSSTSTIQRLSKIVSSK